MLVFPARWRPGQIDAPVIFAGHGDDVVDRHVLEAHAEISGREGDQAVGVARLLASVENDADHVFRQLARGKELAEGLGCFAREQGEPGFDAGRVELLCHAAVLRV